MLRTVIAATLFLILLGMVAPLQAADISLTVTRHDPCNMFRPDQPVTFAATIKGATGTPLQVTVTDYKQKLVMTKEIPVATEAGKPTLSTIDLGLLPTGYYEAVFSLAGEAAATETPVRLKAPDKVCFGVAPEVRRTAKEVRDGGYRFGLKIYGMGKAWWKGNIDFSEKEAVASMTALGLQWTRVLLQDKGEMSTETLLKDYPINAILKVERFPKELYDEKRYGPMEDYEKANGKGVWVLKTLPKEAEYKAWLKEEVQKLPADQNVFEIWNEAWDKMSPEDLATISQWIADTILSVRPEAIIGPNLKGNTSQYEYDALYIKAGGMKGMKMVALHPYAGSEDRGWLRKYRQWLKDQTGRDIDIYVTEYGSHSCPEGPSKRSEEEQAKQVVRQSLALYAEDVKAFTPHWLTQREQNPTYHEDWFGYYRLNNEPKPVLLGLAACARMIDSKRYVGDLWYGPGVGAMLFEKGGRYTLALYTLEGEKTVNIPIIEGAKLISMVGTGTPLKVENGECAVNVSPDVCYVDGVSPDLEKIATKELRADRWPQPEKAPRTVRKAVKAKDGSMKMDGDLSEWKGMLQMAMVNPKVNGADASGLSSVTWDDKYLYIMLDMRDDQVMNDKPRGKLYQQDSMELFVSSEPREENPGYGPHDHQFFVAPDSSEKKPIVGKVTDREAGVVTDVPGAVYTIRPQKGGWLAEVALPWSVLPGFQPAAGAKLALEMRVNDADKSHERWKIDPEDGNVRPEDPTVWSLLILE